MLSIFDLLTAENWNNLLLEYMYKNGNGAAIFFSSGILIGSYMILNLFLAVVLNFVSENIDFEDSGKFNQFYLKLR